MPRLDLALGLVVMAASAVAAADPTSEIHAAVNRYRRAAGLHEVALDAALGDGCRKHVEYLRLNQGNPALAGLGVHDEHPDLPGATPEGAACGKQADLFVGTDDLARAVDGFVAGIYHRRPLLDPALAKIGAAYTTLPDGTYIVALRFAPTHTANGTWPVAYPADREADVPLELGKEIPDPLPGASGAGYPITLQFPPFDRVTGVAARLTDARGRDVPCALSDPEHPATAFPQGGIVSLIPRHRLAPATTYTVAIDATWRGKSRHWSWRFTTVALRELDASDRPAMQQALGVPSRVRGRVTYAGALADGTVFLQLGRARPMVSVLVPGALWRALAGGAAPRRWIGRAVEVDSTPQLVAKSFINLAIEAGDQLR